MFQILRTTVVQLNVILAAAQRDLERRLKVAPSAVKKKFFMLPRVCAVHGTVDAQEVCIRFACGVVMAARCVRRYEPSQFGVFVCREDFNVVPTDDALCNGFPRIEGGETK